MRVCRIHSRINIWTGKVIVNWNHYKSMLATIHTMFVNEKINRIYPFCPFSTWDKIQKHFKRSIGPKISHPLMIPKTPKNAPPCVGVGPPYDKFQSYPIHKKPSTSVIGLKNYLAISIFIFQSGFVYISHIYIILYV